MAVDTQSSELVSAVALLGAAVVAVPIFKRIGLGSVVGYLVAGIAIGPFGLQLFREPDQILGVAEFGVVLLLFVIGLELKPSRLWALRADIFGLGAAQVIACGALLTGAGMLAGLTPAVAFVAASGIALSSTAIVMQILEERGETTETYGQKTFAVLLLQDLAIVPLLAVLAVIAPHHMDGGQSRLAQTAIAVGAIVGLVAVGRYLLNPLFQVLAAAKAREIMAAAALLVVLGAALAMQAGGLSMAMGAFIAGVLLSESSFRHQLEADIEPFRGLLLGLFFLAVGMSIDLGLIARDWPLVLAAVVLHGMCRHLWRRPLFRNGHGDSLASLSCWLRAASSLSCCSPRRRGSACSMQAPRPCSPQR
jgi:glutathione-regulated potassium-efflux system protein KefB